MDRHDQESEESSLERDPFPVTFDRHDLWLVTILVLLGAALRVPVLFTGLYTDESGTYFDVAQTSITDLLRRVAFSESAPPGYFLFMWSWVHAFGISDFVLKFPSFLFGTATIAVSYVLGRLYASRAAGAFGALLLAGSTHAIRISGDARPYALAGLLAACTAVAFSQALYSRRPRLWIAALFACGVATIYVHYVGVIVVVGLALSLPYLAWKEGRWSRASLVGIALAAIAIASLPVVLALRHDAPTRTAWLAQMPSGDLRSRLVEQFGWLSPVGVLHSQTGYIVLISLLVAGAAYAVRGVRFGKGALPGGPIITGLACVLFGGVVETLTYMRAERYMYVFMPIAMPALGAGLIWVWQAMFSRTLLAAARVAIALVVVWIGGGVLLGQPGEYVKFYTHRERSGVRALASDARRLDARGDVLFVFVPDSAAGTFQYYLRDWVDPAPAMLRYPHWDTSRDYGVADINAPPDDQVAVSKLLAQVAASPPRFDKVAVVVSDRAQDPTTSFGRHAIELIQRLKASYPLAERRNYEGYEEPMTLMILKRGGAESPVSE